MKFKFIFWDNDGVLVNTERLYFQANLEALSQIGIRLTHTQFAVISLVHGQTVFELASQAGHNQEEIERLRFWRNARYMQLIVQNNLVMPGVQTTLRRLHRQLGMAVVTSSRRDHFEMIHRKTNLLQFFDFVLTREDYDLPKPDPEPYLLALANSRMPAAECLVIEDSPRGLSAAKAAGLTCWVIPSPETRMQEFPGADKILAKVDELVPLLF